MVADPHQPLARHLAWLVLWVLGLGLPQFLVLCRHDDGPAHVEFARAEGTCHDQDRRDTPPAPNGEHRSHDDCQHTSFEVELQLPRRGANPSAPAALPCGAADLAVPPRLTASSAAAPPPATGPPRPERRSAIRVTTVRRE